MPCDIHPANSLLIERFEVNVVFRVDSLIVKCEVEASEEIHIIVRCAFIRG